MEQSPGLCGPPAWSSSRTVISKGDLGSSVSEHVATGNETAHEVECVLCTECNVPAGRVGSTSEILLTCTVPQQRQAWYNALPVYDFPCAGRPSLGSLPGVAVPNSDGFSSCVVPASSVLAGSLSSILACFPPSYPQPVNELSPRPCLLVRTAKASVQTSKHETSLLRKIYHLRGGGSPGRDSDSNVFEGNSETWAHLCPRKQEVRKSDKSRSSSASRRQEFSLTSPGTKRPSSAGAARSCWRGLASHVAKTEARPGRHLGHAEHRLRAIAPSSVPAPHSDRSMAGAKKGCVYQNPEHDADHVRSVTGCVGSINSSVAEAGAFTTFGRAPVRSVPVAPLSHSSCLSSPHSRRTPRAPVPKEVISFQGNITWAFRGASSFRSQFMAHKSHHGQFRSEEQYHVEIVKILVARVIANAQARVELQRVLEDVFSRPVYEAHDFNGVVN